MDEMHPHRVVLRLVLEQIEVRYLKAKARGVDDPVFVVAVHGIGKPLDIDMITRDDAIERASALTPDVVRALKNPVKDRPLTVIVLGENESATVFDCDVPESPA